MTVENKINKLTRELLQKSGPSLIFEEEITFFNIVSDFVDFMNFEPIYPAQKSKPLNLLRRYIGTI